MSADDGADREHTEQLSRRLATYRAAVDGRIEALRAQVFGLEKLSRDLRKPAPRTARGER